MNIPSARKVSESPSTDPSTCPRRAGGADCCVSDIQPAAASTPGAPRLRVGDPATAAPPIACTPRNVLAATVRVDRLR